MATLSLAITIMSAGLLSLLVLLLRLAARPPLPRLAGELATATLLLGALGWGVFALAQRLPQ